MNEDDQYKASNFIKKNNDDDQYHASNFIKKNKKNNPGWLERNANFAEEHINKPIESLGRSARDVIGGTAQGLANIAPGLYDLGASGINALGGNIPKIKPLDVLPNSPSAKAGEIGSFFVGPGALNSLAKFPAFLRTTRSAMKIPMIADAIKHAGNILGKSPTASRVAGNAVLGGAYSPDNPLLGIGLGAAGGAVGEGIGKGYNGIKNSLKDNEFLNKTLAKFNPAAHAKELENHLSGGANNITQNSRQLATDIRNAHKMREEESGAFFNHALKSAGNEPIYEIHPYILNKPDESKKTMDMIKDLNVGDLFNIFKSKPTFSNAHALQSELGYMEREIQNRAIKTGTEKLELAKVKAARKGLKNDINQFLEKRDLTSNQPISGHYKKGSDLYEANVAPFLSHKKLLDIVKNGTTDIKNLSEVFDTPTNKMTKDGLEKIGSINKIMKDLPENAKQRIIFDAIGGNKLSPEALIKKLDDIKSQGFESYFTPEVEESINALGQKLKNKTKLKLGAGAAGAIGGVSAANKAINSLL